MIVIYSLKYINLNSFKYLVLFYGVSLERTHLRFKKIKLVKIIFSLVLKCVKIMNAQF